MGIEPSGVALGLFNALCDSQPFCSCFYWHTVFPRNVVRWWDCIQSGDFGVPLAFVLLKRAAFVAGTCVFALGGALIGGIAGAMKGHTTETGFCHGAVVGIISGAIVALELLDSIIDGHFRSKVALFGSIVNGKAFMEWVSPAVLKAYQWQIGMLDGSSSNGIGNIYEIDESKGMPLDLLDKIPMIIFDYSQLPSPHTAAVSCPICLQDLVDGESARILPGCEHLFHLSCIDEWLVSRASCPLCRQQVGSQNFKFTA